MTWRKRSQHLLFIMMLGKVKDVTASDFSLEQYPCSEFFHVVFKRLDIG